MLLQLVINGFISGLLYSLVAMGFALVYNTTKIFHLAAAGLYVVAAYAFYSFVSLLHFPILPGAIMAIAVTMGVSLLTEVAVYRPLSKKRSPHASLIASVGMLTILVNFTVLLYGNAPKVVDNTLKKTYQLGNILVSQPQAWQAGISLVAIVLFMLFIHVSSWGKKFRALSDDEALFSILGYSRAVTRNVAFLFSGALIALSSCLNVYEVGMDANMGMNILINSMAAMIIGGIGRFDACVVGGVMLGLIQSLSLLRLPSSWQSGVTFLLLIVFLFLRPQGFFGYKQRTV